MARRTKTGDIAMTNQPGQSSSEKSTNVGQQGNDKSGKSGQQQQSHTGQGGQQGSNPSKGQEHTGQQNR